MWGALDVEPGGLDIAAGHIGDILSKLDTAALGAVASSADVYGDAGLAGEVYLAMGEAQGQRAVVRAVLTCTREEFDALAGDFRSFVGSLGPDV